MALVDVVKWDNPGTQLVRKFPRTDLATTTQLVVNDSQKAIFFRDGQRLDVFGAGRHTLSTQNIPLLNRIINLALQGFEWVAVRTAGAQGPTRRSESRSPS